MTDPRVTRRTAMAAAAFVVTPRGRARGSPDKPEPFELDGYTDQVSYSPGDEVKLHISSQTNGCGVTIARAGVKDEVVWQEGSDSELLDDQGRRYRYAVRRPS
jgi:hypothetical protein